MNVQVIRRLRDWFLLRRARREAIRQFERESKALEAEWWRTHPVTYPRKSLDDNTASAWALEYTHVSYFDERTHRCRLGDQCRTNERHPDTCVRGDASAGCTS